MNSINNMNNINNVKKTTITLLLAFLLCFTTAFVNVQDVNAATGVPFTHTKVAVSKTYLSKFVINYTYSPGKKIKGAYSESGAKAFKSKGTATRVALSNTSKASKLVFHYAVFLDKGSTNTQKLNLQNALTYIHQGSKGLTEAQVNKAKEMIAESQKYSIPEYYNFKAYRYKASTADGKAPSFIGYMCDPYQIRVGISYEALQYKDAIKKFGGYPIYLPYIKDEASAFDNLADVDCLLIPGGSGVNPKYYGETQRNTGSGSALRDPTDYNYIKAALALDMPVLSICRGHQMMNVVTGGTLFQDIKKEYGSSENHKKTVHGIRVFKGSMLAGIIGSGSHNVYCNHHQCVARIGKSIKVNARSINGVIEASNVLGNTFALSLQFHPESQKTINTLDTYKIFTRYITEGMDYVQGMGIEPEYMRNVHIPTEKEINDALNEEDDDA